MEAKEIITDTDFLKKKSIDVDFEKGIEQAFGLTRFQVPVLQVIDELIATATANQNHCAGLAANQIGYLAKIFVIRLHGNWYPIINPEIIASSIEIKQKKENCLSRPGQPYVKVRRHKYIVLRYTVFNNKGEPEPMQDKIEGFNAQVVQHEINHLEGTLI